MFMELAWRFDQPFFSFSSLPAITARNFWENLDPELAGRLVQGGVVSSNTPYPVIKATDYLEFSRSGNREVYEEKQFSRRTILNSLVLAECVENKGRFMDGIVNGIYAICEESAWQLPAHNTYTRNAPQLPLPDVTRPVLDLFCCETGAVLATAGYLLKSRLDEISPVICTMIQSELERRILLPYQKEHFWWMGDGISPMNNWTIWCTQNVLLTAFFSDLPEVVRRQIFLKACKSIDYFLNEYGEDGCCDEGAQYYRHAGLCLFGCLEILNEITGGHFSSLYDHAKIKNIASYILNVHVDGNQYINFSDCSPAAGRCNAREFMFGKRIRDPELMRLAALDYKEGEDPLLTEEHNLFYRLLTVLHHEEMTAYPTSQPVIHRDIFYPSVGLFVVRDSRYCLAVKAGDNDDSHNHNDTGSFTVYKDGRPLFADIGVETYQKKTFSPQRYGIWTMQSQYHNLPSFIGPSNERLMETYPFACLPFKNPKTDQSGADKLMLIQQNDGPRYAAKAVACELSGSSPSISMELAGAYPDLDGADSGLSGDRPEMYLRSYRRSVVFKKEKGIYIIDAADCGGLTPILSLITYEEPEWDANTGTLSIGSLGSCRITGASDVSLERLPITDKRLQIAWKHDMWRILATMQSGGLTLEIH